MTRFIDLTGEAFGQLTVLGCVPGPNELDDAERTARTELQRIAVALEVLVAHTLGSKAM